MFGRRAAREPGDAAGRKAAAASRRRHSTCGRWPVRRHAGGLRTWRGSVWDWTSDCHVAPRAGRAPDAPEDADLSRNCGIRVAAGRHIAYLPDFIRDPKNGACSVGVPPANLGMRL
ncbi:hypothetical protein CTI14_44450, partial [Methylobacterium radiotolerans]